MTRWARCWSLQRFGSSLRALSSASRARALSTSKVPPQQPDRLLDLIDNGLDFRAHMKPFRVGIIGPHLAMRGADCNWRPRLAANRRGLNRARAPGRPEAPPGAGAPPARSPR